MTKYIKVDWPESQKFDGYEECFVVMTNNPWDRDATGSLMVPEELYEKVLYKLQFPKKYENTNLGTVVCYETRAIVNEEIYWYDEEDIKRGNIALIYDENGNWHTSKIVACSKGFPIMLEDSEFIIGINCELIGHRDPGILTS